MPRHDWNDAFLDRLRHTVDPMADRAVTAILDSGQLASVNALMRTLTHNDMNVPTGLPPAVRDYFEQTEQLPAWVDPDRVHRGEQVFMRYGLQALQALMYRSLPECYGCADGALVLRSTQRMTELTQQRVVETLHFIIDVMAPGGLGPGGRGLRSAQRVRLLHASIRAHLRKHDWDEATLGAPINQEDMIGTLSTFSALVVDAMGKLGVHLDATEQDAYMHCWNVVGHVMGVPDENLFHDLADGLALSRRIRARRHRRSEAGVALTRSLLAYTDSLVPSRVLDSINPTLMRHLCGEELADMLEVPPSNWAARRLLRRYIDLVVATDDFQDEGEHHARLGEKLGNAIVRGLLGVTRTGDRPDFAIPDELLASWNV